MEIPGKSDEKSVCKDMVGVVVVTIIHGINSVKNMDVVVQAVHVGIVVSLSCGFDIAASLKREVVTLKIVAISFVEDSSS